jgi:S-formylglutathione hydrolase FrmB
VRTRVVLVTIAALALFVGPGPGGGGGVPIARAAASTPPLVLLADQVLSPDGRLHELTLASDALGRATRVQVLLPARYDERTDERFPVLYLLHGAGGNEDDWTDNTDVEELTARVDLVVVMPDGGPDGWYSDWVTGPRWESHHVGELVPWVDEHYRTVHGRGGRAVVGNSMGGFGAMVYAARHPDLFATAFAFSGAVDNSIGADAQAKAFELAHDRFNTPTTDVWGEYRSHQANWAGHNPPDLATNLQWTDVELVTGSGIPRIGDRPETVPVEAGVLLLTTSFHAALVRAGVEHEWRTTTFGTHDWHYWEDDLHDTLPALLASLADPPAAPEAFDYRSTEEAFAVWGWAFEVHRAEDGFVDLADVSTAGLTAAGAGTLDVVTPPCFVPGASYLVGETTTVAGDDGRLRFAVTLQGSGATVSIASASSSTATSRSTATSAC